MAAHADSYGGLWNAYAGRLQYAVAYVSDSNGYWQFKSWDKMLGEAPPRLQVLTHADWWLEEDLPPSENVSRILEARSRDTWADYVSTLTRAGRTMMCGTPVVQEVLVRQLNEPEIWRLWLAGDETSAYMKLLALLASERTVARPEVSAEQRAFVESLCAGQVPDAAVLGSLFEAAARELIALRAPGSAIAD